MSSAQSISWNNHANACVHLPSYPIVARMYSISRCLHHISAAFRLRFTPSESMRVVLHLDDDLPTILVLYQEVW